MNRTRTRWARVAVLMMIAVSACAKPKPPVVRPQPPAVAGAEEVRPPAPPRPPAPSVPVDERVVTPSLSPDAIGSKNLDELNREAPLAPVFFALDRFDLDAAARAVLDDSARVLRQQPTWQVTVEGHCDERGTAEYNISLGERRAVAAKAYLVSLGIAADRLRTVSFGKEFPFDLGHDEAAWAKNRRAHFVITAR